MLLVSEAAVLVSWPAQQASRDAGNTERSGVSCHGLAVTCGIYDQRRWRQGCSTIDQMERGDYVRGKSIKHESLSSL